MVMRYNYNKAGLVLEFVDIGGWVPLFCFQQRRAYRIKLEVYQRFNYILVVYNFNKKKRLLLLLLCK